MDHRLEVEDDDTITISPKLGEAMCWIKIAEVNESTEEMPNGALDVTVIPLHMDGVARDIVDITTFVRAGRLRNSATVRIYG